MSRLRHLTLAISVGQMLLTASASQALAGEWEQVRNGSFKLVGYLERRGDQIFVRDCHGTQIGYTTPQGTYAGSTRVSPSSVPTALLSKRVSGCPALGE